MPDYAQELRDATNRIEILQNQLAHAEERALHWELRCEDAWAEIEAFRARINELETQWVPVGIERPDTERGVLVTLHRVCRLGNFPEALECAAGRWEDDAWWDDNGEALEYGHWHVTAWCERPIPYEN